MSDQDQSIHSVQPQRRSWLVPILLGIVIGILLVTFIKSDTTSPNDNLSEDSQPEDYPTLNVDVTTQITEVVADVSPAVVGVTNIQVQTDYWQQQERDEAGTGSGVIYKIEDDIAYIVTNHHVIVDADTVEIILYDDQIVEAEIIGSDTFSDLAVLRMDANHVEKVIEIGSSDNLKVGEPAIAIGNPLGHLFAGSVTQGVISGTQRTIPVDFNQDGRADWQTEVLQTDAAINPGNSGGALIDINGTLIGINSMKINQGSVEGIGFAIPIDAALPIIQELEATGEVKRAYLGIESYSLDELPRTEWSRTLNLPPEVEGGVYVWSLEEGSPADQAGLMRLDVITKLDGQQINDAIDLRKILYKDKNIGDELDVTFYRDSQRYETTLILGTQG